MGKERWIVYDCSLLKNIGQFIGEDYKMEQNPGPGVASSASTYMVNCGSPKSVD